MKKHLLFLLLFASLCGMAQSTKSKPNFIRNQVNVNAFMEYYVGNTRCFGISGNYGINNWIETGACFGVFALNIYNDNTKAINYKLNAKAHIVNVFAPSFYAIDPYLVARMGGLSVFGDSAPRTMFTYNVGGGIALNFSRHFGLFYELYYDNTFHKSVKSFGLNIRFNGPKKWRKE